MGPDRPVRRLGDVPLSSVLHHSRPRTAAEAQDQRLKRVDRRGKERTVIGAGDAGQFAVRQEKKHLGSFLD